MKLRIARKLLKRGWGHSTRPQRDRARIALGRAQTRAIRRAYESIADGIEDALLADPFWRLSAEACGTPIAVMSAVLSRLSGIREAR